VHLSWLAAARESTSATEDEENSEDSQGVHVELWKMSCGR